MVPPALMRPTTVWRRPEGQRTSAPSPSRFERVPRRRTWRRATSAAPTYFPPLRLDSLGPDPDTERTYYALVDGGVFANNPSLCAYVEAMSGGPESRDCLMVSIGTGQWTTPIPYGKARRWGLAAWARPILDVVFDGASDTIDDTGPANIGKLKGVATAIIQRNDATLTRLAQLLRS